MKIHIYFELRYGAWGGGNQFLKALREYFIAQGVYVDDYNEADVIIFNSHHFLDGVVKIKFKHPEKIFIHRIDGPIMHYRDGNPSLDFLIFEINSILADGTVFQSEYSKAACSDLGLNNDIFEATIVNAPNSDIFNKVNRIEFSTGRKTKLIATSWSDNWRKGFDTYKWLDENLDFCKYEMKFIGNTPVKFKNIQHIQPLSSEKLALQLQDSDIFIFASKVESCSNSLLEAIHSGLPVIAYNSTGNPELVGNAGLTFNEKEEIPFLLNSILLNYKSYVNGINLPTMDRVGSMYFDFFIKILNNKKYVPKKISYMLCSKLLIEMFFEKVKYKIGIK